MLYTGRGSEFYTGSNPINKNFDKPSKNKVKQKNL